METLLTHTAPWLAAAALVASVRHALTPGAVVVCPAPACLRRRPSTDRGKM